MVTLALLGGVTAIGLSGLDIRYPEPEENDEPAASYAIGKDTIYLWYTDESLTDYLNTEAVNYSSVNDEIRVVPALRLIGSFLLIAVCGNTAVSRHLQLFHRP